MAERDRAPSFDPLTVCSKIITLPPSKETFMKKHKFCCFETNKCPYVLVFAFIFFFYA